VIIILDVVRSKQISVAPVPYFRAETSHFRAEISFLPVEKTFLRAEKSFLRTEKPFLGAEKSFFGSEIPRFPAEKLFLGAEISFFRAEISDFGPLTGSRSERIRKTGAQKIPHNGLILRRCAEKKFVRPSGGFLR
jgi:hypothetical protein